MRKEDLTQAVRQKALEILRKPESSVRKEKRKVVGRHVSISIYHAQRKFLRGREKAQKQIRKTSKWEKMAGKLDTFLLAKAQKPLNT